MALEGFISEFGLADIFQLIYFQKKSGLLEVESPVDRVKVFFSEGNIVSVKSHRRPEEKRIGQVLIKRHIIDEPTLQRLLEKQKQTGQRIGILLLQEGLVSVEEISDLIKKNIIEQVAQLFKLTSGSYVFRPKPVTTEEELPISLDTQHILMDSLRVIDEWSNIEDVLTIDTIFKKTERKETEEAISEEERAILQYIDGENDVSVIVELSGLDDYHVSKTLVSLYEKGFIEPLEEEKQVSQQEPTRKTVISPAVINYLIPIVIVITFLISLVTSPKNILVQVRRLQAISDIENIKASIDREYLKTDTYPPADSVSMIKDPWGRLYYYEVSPDGKDYTLLSAGPDGILKSNDDVY